MNGFHSPLGRADMLGWLALQGEDITHLDKASDDDVKKAYDDYRASDAYIDQYGDFPKSEEEKRQEEIEEKTR